MYSIAIDIGGTFTDIIISDGKDNFSIAKVPSTPFDPSISFINAVELALKLEKINASKIDTVFHGSTVATNAIIEKKFSKTALLTTKGFRHIFEIGRGEIPREKNLYSWTKPKRPILAKDIYEIDERINKYGKIEKSINIKYLNKLIKHLVKEKYLSIAIVFIHSYLNSNNEKIISKELKNHFSKISISSEVLPIFREYERTSVTVLNALIQPIVGNYIEKITSKMKELQINSPLFIMKSNGGVYPPDEAKNFGIHMALSGPAAGTKGAAFLGKMIGLKNLITIDIGGTSADVSIINNYNPQIKTSTKINENPLPLPVIDIHTIGAGGGSIASVTENGSIVVGPNSAGADPGPASYGKGGKLPTVTDANLILGRIPPYLLGGKIKLDIKAAEKAIDKYVAKPLGTNIYQAAIGIIDIINENMNNALKLMSVEKGLDPANYALAAFGGAGPIHGGFLLRLLAAKCLFIPRYPGILCANGLLSTDLIYDFVITRIQKSNNYNFLEMDKIFSQLTIKAKERFAKDNVSKINQRFIRSIDLKYSGQGNELNVEFPSGKINSNIINKVINNFHNLHKKLYTFSNLNKSVDIVNFRIKAIGKRDYFYPPKIKKAKTKQPDFSRRRSVYAENGKLKNIPVFDKENLFANHEVIGPAIIEQEDSTIFILKNQQGRVDLFGNILVKEI